MAAMMRRAADRITAETLPSDPQVLPSRPKPLGIAGKSVARAAAREAIARSGLSQKEIALNAGIPEQRFSDALKEDGQRNFEIGWILAQDVEFVALFLDIVSRKLGLRPRERRPLTATDIGAIVSELIERVS